MYHLFQVLTTVLLIYWIPSANADLIQSPYDPQATPVTSSTTTLLTCPVPVDNELLDLNYCDKHKCSNHTKLVKTDACIASLHKKVQQLFNNDTRSPLEISCYDKVIKLETDDKTQLQQEYYQLLQQLETKQPQVAKATSVQLVKQDTNDFVGPQLPDNIQKQQLVQMVLDTGSQNPFMLLYIIKVNSGGNSNFVEGRGDVNEGRGLCGITPITFKRFANTDLSNIQDAVTNVTICDKILKACDYSLKCFFGKRHPRLQQILDGYKQALIQGNW